MITFIILFLIIFIFYFVLILDISVFYKWKYYSNYWKKLDVETLSKQTSNRFNNKSIINRIKINKIYGVQYIETLIKLQDQEKCYKIVDNVIFSIKNEKYSSFRIKEHKSYNNYLSYFKMNISIFNKSLNPNKKSYDFVNIDIILKDGVISLLIDNIYKVSTTNKIRYNSLCLIIFEILDRERLKKEKDFKKSTPKNTNTSNSSKRTPKLN